MKTAAEYGPVPVAAAKIGYCCVPGLYNSASSCATVTSLASTMKSSKVWETRELALANCPNITTVCGAAQSLDLDANAGVAQKATVGASGKILTKNDACSYIVKSKCKAPTVDFELPTSTDSDKAAIYDISYVEYSENSFTTATTAQTTISVDVKSSEESTKILGG
jgi:hypothetical protein